jgi:endoglucanase
VHCYSPYDFCLSDKQKVFDPKNRSHTSSIDSVFNNAYNLFLKKGIPVVIGETSATNNGNNTVKNHLTALRRNTKCCRY